MTSHTTITRWFLRAGLAVAFGIPLAPSAHAQGFISPAYGYNFGGDSGCVSALDCEDKNWNFSLSGGALGGIFGFEAEWTYEDQFLGDTGADTSSVTTLMANFMLAPKISIVQPYGLIGLGIIRTSEEHVAGEESESDNDPGWTVGGGVIVYVHRNIGIKGDIRYYHSFDALDLLGLEIATADNKLDFGRGAFGVVFKF